MKRFTLRKKIVAGAAAVALAAALGGGAYAYFTSDGTGTGQASVGDLQTDAWDVDVSTDATGAIYPGSGQETLDYTITNSDTGSQALTSVTASVDSENDNITQGGVEVPGCLADWFNATASAPDPILGTSLAVGESATGTVIVTMDNVNSPQDACAGADPDITVNAL